MADAAIPSEEELEQLSNPSIAAPGDSTPEPDPEPEVLKRAQELINRAGNRESEAETPENPVPEISDDQKLRFMAHILGGKPFSERYKLLGGAFLVEYRNLTPLEEESLSELVLRWERDQELAKGRRRLRYRQLAMATAISSLQLEGVAVTPRFDANSKQFLEDYQAWLRGLSGGQYQLLDHCYARFRQLLEYLFERSTDPDFWPTPS